MLKLRDLVQAGQIEVLGGLFYSAPPALISEVDVRGHIEMMGQFWESYLGGFPRGFWLPELAWCAEVPRLLQDAGLEYSFASAAQLVDARDHQGLCVLHRGDQRVALFVLDDVMSSA